MTVTNKEAQATAVLFLAAGKSKADAARQAGVRPATVAAWLKKPAYVAEVEAFRAVLATRPGRDALLAAVEESRRRIMGASATPGRRTVQITIPPYASKQQRRRIVTRAIARAMAEATPEAS